MLPKWLQKGTNWCRNASRPPPIENDKKGILKPGKRLAKISPKCIQECQKHVWWLFFRIQKAKSFHQLFVLVSLCLYEAFGVPRGVIFYTFVVKKKFFCEKVGPSFLHRYSVLA